jgi:hypothetical protein
MAIRSLIFRTNRLLRARPMRVPLLACPAVSVAWRLSLLGKPAVAPINCPITTDNRSLARMALSVELVSARAWRDRRATGILLFSGPLQVILWR